MITSPFSLGGMTAPRSFADSIDSALDVDLFKFTVTREQRISFDLDSTGTLNSYLRLFDSAGNPLNASVSDNAAGPGETNNNRDPYLENVFLTTGTHYVGVSNSKNISYSAKNGTGDTAGGTTGSYTLLLKSSLSTDNGIKEAAHFDIQRFGNFPGAIEPTTRTWVIVHGLNSNRGQMSGLAQAVQHEQPSDQVLTPDWSQAAKALNPGAAELWIPTVAQWAQSALSGYGFSTDNLNLIGHSFGSYVCAEIAERKAHGVNTIVGLDPARDVPDLPGGTTGYSSNASAHFANYSKFSWAFHSSDSLGNAITPTSADEAFVVRIGSNPVGNHTGIVDLFGNVLYASDAISQRFALHRLLSHQKGPWQPNQLSVSGGRSPSISSVSPSPVTASPNAQPFTINGSNFVNGANVTLRDLTTGITYGNRAISTFTSNGIVINPTFLSAGHSWSVEVINPDGKTSGQVNFSVVGPPVVTPSISSVSPNPVTAMPGPQPFTINGSSFVSGCNVILRDLTTGTTYANRAISSFASDRIVINPTFLTSGRLWSVEIINPDGKATGQFNFTVR